MYQLDKCKEEINFTGFEALVRNYARLLQHYDFISTENFTLIIEESNSYKQRDSRCVTVLASEITTLKSIGGNSELIIC